MREMELEHHASLFRRERPHVGQLAVARHGYMPLVFARCLVSGVARWVDDSRPGSVW